jgi:hypothetical protein
MKIKVTVRQLEWVAGFLEGEGYFASRKGVGTMRVDVGQVQLEPLQRLLDLFGGSISLHKRNKEKHHLWVQQDIYHWQLSGLAAAGLCMTLYPLMSTGRKGQIRVALDKWKVKPARSQYRSECPKGHPYSGLNLILVTGDRSGKKYKNRACRICREMKWKAKLVGAVRAAGGSGSRDGWVYPAEKTETSC